MTTNDPSTTGYPDGYPTQKPPAPTPAADDDPLTQGETPAEETEETE